MFKHVFHAQKTSAFVVALTAGSMVLAGCSSDKKDASSTSSTTSSAVSSAAATSASGSEAATSSGGVAASSSSAAATAVNDAKGSLTIWHYEGPESAMGKAWAAAIKNFQAKHPNVKVNFELKAFEQIQKTAPLILNSKDAPDVMEYNKGNATAGLLSKQGLLTDLTDQVTKRGWDKIVSDDVKTTSVYENGLMGSGKWYGVPNYAEYLMVYYNKDMFETNGVKVPTNPDELTAALEAFKGKGITPFANAGAEYIGQQYLYQLALSQADRDWVDRYERFTGKTDFHDKPWTYAATTFADWVQKGYIDKKSVATKATDAGLAFTSGKNPMFFSGSWWAGTIGAAAKFNWSTFNWPGSKLTPGSGGNIWVVPAGSKNKDLAYDFIDETMTKENQNLLGNSGGVPIGADPAAITDAKAKDLITGFNNVSAAAGLSFYPDWPVPGFYDVMTAAVQKLMNGTDPNKVLDDLQKAYDAGAPKK